MVAVFIFIIDNWLPCFLCVAAMYAVARVWRFPKPGAGYDTGAEAGSAEKPIVAEPSMWGFIRAWWWNWLIPVGFLILVFITDAFNTFSIADCLKFLLLWNTISLGFYMAGASFFGKRYIFDEDGITVEKRIRILCFTVHEWRVVMPWDSISPICYREWDNKIPVCCFFACTEDYLEASIDCYVRKNRTECLEYAVKKLPREIFDFGARKKLKSLGIWKDGGCI